LSFCDYETGMGSDEFDVAGMNYLSLCRIFACHEAGHAVVSYALGLGCTGIVIETEPDLRAYAKSNKAASRRLSRRRSRGRFTADLLALGVVAAAGTAAHRRLFAEIGYSKGNIGSADDREIIDAAAQFMGRDPRSRFAPNAYRRLVWRLAQLAMEDPRIWGAVLNVMALTNDWLAKPQGTRSATKTMHGATLRAIARRAGVARGMFGDSVHEMSRESWFRRHSARLVARDL